MKSVRSARLQDGNILIINTNREQREETPNLNKSMEVKGISQRTNTNTNTTPVEDGQQKRRLDSNVPQNYTNKVDRKEVEKSKEYYTNPLNLGADDGDTPITTYFQELEDSPEFEAEKIFPTLAIAFYNLGVENEYIKEYSLAINFYKKGLEFSNKIFGTGSKMSKSIMKSLKETKSKLDKNIEYHFIRTENRNKGTTKNLFEHTSLIQENDMRFSEAHIKRNFMSQERLMSARPTTRGHRIADSASDKSQILGRTFHIDTYDSFLKLQTPLPPKSIYIYIYRYIYIVIGLLKEQRSQQITARGKMIYGEKGGEKACVYNIKQIIPTSTVSD